MADQITVPARLSNDEHTYNVSLRLALRPVFGSGNSVDDYAIAGSALVGAVGVESGTYDLEYEFMGKYHKDRVRLIDGELVSAVAA